MLFQNEYRNNFLRLQNNRSKTYLLLLICFRNWFGIFLLFFNIQLSAQDVLFRINKLVNRQTYLWGMIDINGKVKIPTKFEGLGEFSDNVAFAESEAKWGLINRKGEYILKPEFQDVRDFENGLAWVIQNCTKWIVSDCDRGKWGLINNKGEILIYPKYDGVLSEEAPYIPRIFGRPAGELMHDNSYFGKDGFARVYVENDDPFNRIRKYGIVNKDGKEIVSPEYYKIGFFQNEIAPFAMSGGKGIYYGLIHVSGKILLEPNFYKSIESVVDFEDQRSEVLWAGSYYDEDKKKTLIRLLSKEGKEISELRFHQFREFENGLAFARLTNTLLWGQINKYGDWELEPTYKSLSEIIPKKLVMTKGIVHSNGRMFYQENEKDALWFSEQLIDSFDKMEREFWGFCDPKGNVVYPARSFEKGLFYDGVSWVSLRYRKKNNSHIIYQALIDEKGNELTPPLYLYTLPFRNGLGVAQVYGGSWGYLNKEGKKIWWD
jgi:hypothetical protein